MWHELQDVCQATVAAASNVGCPVAGQSDDCHAEIAAIALRRWFSSERRLKPPASYSARVEDLARGLCDRFESDPSLVGPLMEDYRWLALQIADTISHPADSGLPPGWTLDRIRAMGVKDASLEPTTTYVVEHGVEEYIEITPRAILNCGGLDLVLDESDGEWHMGQADEDGAIVCWGSYGVDLKEAIEGL